MKAVEKFYSVQDAVVLLVLCSKTVIQKIKNREFGDQVVNLGTAQRPDYRIPATGINAFLDRRRLFSEPGIAARTVGELRRKSAAGEA